MFGDVLGVGAGEWSFVYGIVVGLVLRLRSLARCLGIGFDKQETALANLRCWYSVRVFCRDSTDVERQTTIVGFCANFMESPTRVVTSYWTRQPQMRPLLRRHTSLCASLVPQSMYGLMRSNTTWISTGSACNATGFQGEAEQHYCTRQHHSDSKRQSAIAALSYGMTSFRPVIVETSRE